MTFDNIDLPLALFLLLVVVNVADIVSTLIAIRLGASEGNPLLKPFVERLGVVPGLLALKIPLLVLTYFYAMYPIVLGALCLIFLGVVASNILVIRRIK